MNVKNERIVAAATAAIVATGALFAYAHSNAAAVSSRLIPYNGQLDHDGNPVTGTVAMKLCLVTDPATGCETAPWSESHPAVPVAGGRFSLSLGETTPIADDTFKNTQPIYVRVMVGASADAGATYVQLSGAQRVLSTPFAINAEQASTLRVDGPIYSGAALPTATNLGLYAESPGGGLRFVTANGPIQFFNDGASSNGYSGGSPALTVNASTVRALGLTYVNEFHAGDRKEATCSQTNNNHDVAIAGGGTCGPGDTFIIDNTPFYSNATIKSDGKPPIGWHVRCMNHDFGGPQDTIPPTDIYVVCMRRP